MRALDTAYNYHGFASHRILANTAGDLLGDFTISTKVGFVPGDDGRPRHSLDPQMLRDATAESVDVLGLAPAVIFLHNPELAVSGEPATRLDQLATACGVLQEAVSAGLCQSWGWTSWDPRPLRAVLPDSTATEGVPTPQVLMMRAGLLVPSDVLDSAEHLADLFSLSTSARWGMSPFGGHGTHPVWDTVDPRRFLAPQQNSSHTQAIFRVAYEMPAVDCVAVGTDNPAHLDALIAATDLHVDDGIVARYRRLLRARAVTISKR